MLIIGLSRYGPILKGATYSPGFTSAKYTFEKSFGIRDMISIHVSNDIRMSGISIQCEYYVVKDDGKIYLEQEDQLFGERFTLMYF